MLPSLRDTDPAPLPLGYPGCLGACLRRPPTVPLCTGLGDGSHWGRTRGAGLCQAGAGLLTVVQLAGLGGMGELEVVEVGVLLDWLKISSSRWLWLGGEVATRACAGRGRGAEQDAVRQPGWESKTPASRPALASGLPCFPGEKTGDLFQPEFSQATYPGS